MTDNSLRNNFSANSPGVLLAISLAVLAGFAIWSQEKNPKNPKPEIKISEIYRESLIRYLEVSGELEALSEDAGINFGELKNGLAKVKSTFEIMSNTWPANFQLGVKKDFSNAIEGWTLALDLKERKIENSNYPTLYISDDGVANPVHGWHRYYDYGKDFLECYVEEDGDEFGDKWFSGKPYKIQRVMLGPNISLLLGVASEFSKRGKTQILKALSKDF